MASIRASVAYSRSTFLLLVIAVVVAVPAASVAEIPAALPDLDALSPRDAYALANELWREGRKDEAAAVCRRLVGDEGAEPDQRAGAHWILALYYTETEREGVLAKEHLQAIEREYPESAIWTGGAGPLRLVGLIHYRDDQPAAAATLAEYYLQHLGPGMTPRNRALFILRLADAHGQAGALDVAGDDLSRSLPELLPILDLVRYHEKAVEFHIATRSHDAALSAARAAYALCNYSVRDIQQAAALVRHVWVSRLEAGHATQFLLAQDDPDVPNPLAAVPLPAVSEADAARLLESAGDDPALQISANLYLGRTSEALAIAVEHLGNSGPEHGAGPVLQVARCLKALDLNVLRANEFLNFMRTGEGENPLADLGHILGQAQREAAGDALHALAEVVVDWPALWPAALFAAPNGGGETPHLLAQAGAVLSALSEQMMRGDVFVSWVQEAGIGPEALSAAIDLLTPDIKQLRLNHTMRALGAALHTAAGPQLERLDTVPLPGLLLLAAYLGEQEREEDVRRVLLHAAALDHGMPIQLPYYIVASALLDQQVALRTAIWAWQTGASAAGPPHQALVCPEIFMACRQLDERAGDDAAVRDIFIPWAEQALSMPGSEPQWTYALELLLMAHWTAHGLEAAISRAQDWLDEGHRRGVPQHRLGPSRLAMGRILVADGQFARAEEVMHEAAQAGPPDHSAAVARALRWLEDVRRLQQTN